MHEGHGRAVVRTSSSLRVNVKRLLGRLLGRFLWPGARVRRWLRFLASPAFLSASGILALKLGYFGYHKTHLDRWDATYHSIQLFFSTSIARG
jgi:hypothetical protein